MPLTRPLACLIGLIGVLWFLGTPPALAQKGPSSDAKRKAKAYFKQGKAYQDAGAYDDAIAQYRSAYDLVPLPELLFNIGQSYRLKADKGKAVEYYRRYLEAVPEGRGSDEAREHVAKLRRELEVDETEAA